MDTFENQKYLKIDEAFIYSHPPQFNYQFQSLVFTVICYLLSTAEQGSAEAHPEMFAPFPISQCISR
jgi:hypothetical protein